MDKKTLIFVLIFSLTAPYVSFGQQTSGNSHSNIEEIRKKIKRTENTPVLEVVRESEEIAAHKNDPKFKQKTE